MCDYCTALMIAAHVHILPNVEHCVAADVILIQEFHMMSSQVLVDELTTVEEDYLTRVAKDELAILAEDACT